MPLEVGNVLPERRIDAGGRVYTVVEDLVITDRLVLAGRAIDRVYAEAWRGPFRLRLTSGDQLRAKTGSDGFFAVAGDPERAFPGLAMAPATIDFELSGPGLRPRQVSVPVPAGASFPRPAVTVELDRVPVTLVGRAVEAAAGHAPVPGARVAFSDPALALLRTPLHLDHAAGIEVRACALNPAGAAKALAAPVVRGATTLALGDRIGLGIGGLLRLGADLRWEVVVIESLAPLPANPALPGEVTLRQPVARSFLAGEAVQPLAAVDQAAVAALDAEVYAAAGVLPLSAAVAAASVRVEAAASPRVEYGFLGALSDADGYWRAAGIDRPARAALTATAAGFDPAEVVWAADFAHSPNPIDFRLETP